MTALKMTVTLEGKFFRAGPDVVKDGIKAAVTEIVGLGESHAKGIAVRKTGRYADSLKGRVAKTGRSGRVKSYGKVGKTYAGKLERGDGKTFKGYFALAKTRDVMQGQAQGVLQRHVDDIVRQLD